LEYAGRGPVISGEVPPCCGCGCGCDGGGGGGGAAPTTPGAPSAKACGGVLKKGGGGGAGAGMASRLDSARPCSVCDRLPEGSGATNSWYRPIGGAVCGAGAWNEGGGGGGWKNPPWVGPDGGAVGCPRRPYPSSRMGLTGAVGGGGTGGCETGAADSGGGGGGERARTGYGPGAMAPEPGWPTTP
jgi:hypothetical protein